MYNIKLCFWMQTIYFHNCLGPYRGFGIKEQLYAPSGYNLDTISYSNVAILCFIVKMGYVYKTAPPEKLLPQFDCTACLEMLWKGSSNYFSSQTFSVNFQKLSSLTKIDIFKIKVVTFIINFGRNNIIRN